MKLPRAIGGILGIVFALFLFLIIFGNLIAKPNGSKKSVPEISSPAIKNEAVTRKTSGAVAGSAFEENISKKIAESIAELNGEGLTNLDNEQFMKALNPEKLANDILSEELKNLEGTAAVEFDVAVKISPEKIIANADKRQKEEYLNSFRRTLEKNSRSIAGGKIASSKDFHLITAAYKKTIGEFEQLNVPSDLAGLHRRELALLHQQKIIWERLEQVENNPLPAVIALGKYEETIKNFENLKREISAYIKINKLAVEWL